MILLPRDCETLWLAGTIATMTDAQTTLDRVRGLIAFGHHRDEVPGLPGAALEGGGMFRGNRRLYYRGTEEFADAAAKGFLDRLPPPPPPASPDAIAEAEALIGAPMPTLLKTLYGVANGGFGPGYGLLGLRDGFTDDTRRTAVDILREIPQGRWPDIPSGLLPLCHLGCAIYTSCIARQGGSTGGTPTPWSHRTMFPSSSRSTSSTAGLSRG